MALTEDQRAMLRLLAHNEGGYEDIAALKGLSVEQVKAEVREALRAAGEAENQAPASPAPAPQRPHPPTPPRRALGASLPPQRRRLMVFAAAAALLLAIALGAIAALGGSSSSIPATVASNQGSTAKSSPGLTQAVLSPVNGGSAKGRAIFGRLRNTPVLGVEARGLKPSPAGSSYTVWLYHSPQVVLRIGAVKVGRSGGLAAQFPLPTELLGYVASGAFGAIDLSLTGDAAYKAEVARARREKRLPAYTGEDVLRGPITGPIVKK